MGKKERKEEIEKERKKIPEIPDYLVESKSDLRWKFQQKKCDQATRLQSNKGGE